MIGRSDRSISEWKSNFLKFQVVNKVNSSVVVYWIDKNLNKKSVILCSMEQLYKMETQFKML